MSKKKAPRTPSSMPTAVDQARDELFSHILRCGVLEAAPEHQKEWMDDTMQYLNDRYPNLSAEELGKVQDEADVIEYRQRNELAELFSLFGQTEARTLKVDLGLDVPKLQAGRMYFLSPLFLH